MKKTIYYFTGTGNSMRAAIKIAGVLGDTDIISMRCNPDEVSAEDCDVIGFVFPVYHWTMPAAAARFVENLRINPGAYIFVIAMPSFVCGYACEKCSALISAKGGHVAYGNKVYSVANYVLVYPPMPWPKIVVPRTERELNRIAREISEKKKREIPRAGFFVRSRRDKVMTPYLKLQQYADYPFHISEDCISCGLCTKVCPVRNIIIKNGKPEFQHHCAQCMACVVNCPKRAIGYEIMEEQKDMLPDNTKVVRLMGLPPKRMLYRNPFISAADLTRDRTHIGKTEVNMQDK